MHMPIIQKAWRQERGCSSNAWQRTIKQPAPIWSMGTHLGALLIIWAFRSSKAHVNTRKNGTRMAFPMGACQPLQHSKQAGRDTGRTVLGCTPSLLCPRAQQLCASQRAGGHPPSADPPHPAQTPAGPPGLLAGQPSPWPPGFPPPPHRGQRPGTVSSLEHTY